MQRLHVCPGSVEGLRPGTGEARSDVSRVTRLKNTETETSSRNSEAGSGSGGRHARTTATDSPPTTTPTHATYNTHNTSTYNTMPHDLDRNKVAVKTNIETFPDLKG